jgi:hypothetical protein
VKSISAISSGFLAFFLLSMSALFSGCGKEEIKVYSVPKEVAPATQPAMAQNEISANPNAAPIHWKTPAGWKELEPTSMRVGNFSITDGDKKAEVSVIPFPGKVGTELDNVNRWRKEIGLEPVDETEVSGKTISIGNIQGKLYDLAGSELETIAAILEKDGTSWFFKMRGDKEITLKNKTAFAQFLQSVQFDSAEPVQAPVVEKSASTNPKKISNETSDATSEPKLEIPASWRETPASPMVLKSFSTGNDGHEAKISITVFPGNAGGPLANLNRWRRQLSLEPVDESALSKLTTSIDVLGGKATLVEMTGTDAKTGKPARMIAATVPRKEQTWFYKLMGDEATVAHEKEVFLKFVQTVRYPND